MLESPLGLAPGTTSRTGQACQQQDPRKDRKDAFFDSVHLLSLYTSLVYVSRADRTAVMKLLGQPRSQSRHISKNTYLSRVVQDSACFSHREDIG